MLQTSTLRFLGLLSLTLMAFVGLVQAQETDKLSPVLYFPHEHHVAPTGVVRCASPHIPMDQAMEIERIVQQRRTDRSVMGRTASNVITIPTVFHSIQNTSGAGVVSDAAINQQLAVMNAAFVSMGIQFTLAGITRTTNNSWFQVITGSSTETQMKNTLSVSPATTLNIYLCKPRAQIFPFLPAQPILGQAYFPSSFPETDKRHGVLADYQSLPGGVAPYDEGDTVVHEIGHYVGLFHTFQNGCAAPGDFVDDTPFEAEPNYGPCSNLDTCPSPGLDPVQNYMDYSDDICLDRFSPGQRDRAHGQLSTFRPTIYGNTGGGGTPTPGVDINPTSSTSLPASGGRVRFSATFSNTGTASYTGVYWVTRRAPNGTTTTLSGPTSITLAPGASQTISGQNRLRSGDANGTYTYTANLGPNTSTVDATDSFTATKGTARVTMMAEATSNEAEALPGGFALEGNYPNPFNPTTDIRFTVERAMNIRLAVYDALGREVAVLVEGLVEAGSQVATFNAASLPSGVYLYRLEAEGTVETRSMILLK